MQFWRPPYKRHKFRSEAVPLSRRTRDGCIIAAGRIASVESAKLDQARGWNSDLYQLSAPTDFLMTYLYRSLFHHLAFLWRLVHFYSQASSGRVLAGFCTVAAAMSSESICGPALTYWDEAAIYAILAGARLNRYSLARSPSD